MLPRGKLYWKSDFSAKSTTISILGMYWFKSGDKHNNPFIQSNKE
jgi:hypothetical protein